MATDPDAGWSARHGGLEPSAVVRGWLRLVRACVRPVRRVPPDVLSVAGVLVLAAAVPVATTGAPWVALAGVLVVLGGVLDGLDGAVALATDRARPLGAVVDAVCDRLGDLALLAVLVVLGAPVAGAVAVAAVTLLHEYARARAQSVGMPGAGAVTVAERPTRIIVVALPALGAAALPAVPGPGWSWGTTFLTTWAVLALVGLVQLAVGIRRSIPATFPPEPPFPSEPPDRPGR
jgi:phosphatidylglycerophosphate synthase